MFKISIPKPCTVGWENMHPNEQGRYCNNCAKTVIDFSILTDEEIQHYFIEHWGEEICGKFKNTQLHRIVINIPFTKFRRQIPFWQKFLVACLVVFGVAIFPFETTLGLPQQPTERLQTSNSTIEKKVRIAKKKKNKYKVNRKKIFTQAFDVEFTSTLGITTTTVQLLPPLNLSSEKKDSPDTHSKNAFKKPNPAFPGEKNNHPPKELPPYSSEFVIPANLSTRRKSKKKK